MDLARVIAADLCTSAPVSVRTLVTTLRYIEHILRHENLNCSFLTRCLYSLDETRDQGSKGLEAAYLREATAQSDCYPTRWDTDLG